MPRQPIFRERNDLDYGRLYDISGGCGGYSSSMVGLIRKMGG